MGAIIHDMFTPLEEENVKERYGKGIFVPVDENLFTLSHEAWCVLMKATDLNSDKRYSSINEFHRAWNEALK